MNFGAPHQFLTSLNTLELITGEDETQKDVKSQCVEPFAHRLLGKFSIFSWIKSDGLEQNLSVYFEKKLEKMCDPDPTVLASPLVLSDNQQSFLLLNSSCCPSPSVPDMCVSKNLKCSENVSPLSVQRVAV